MEIAPPSSAPAPPPASGSTGEVFEGGGGYNYEHMADGSFKVVKDGAADGRNKSLHAVFTPGSPIHTAILGEIEDAAPAPPAQPPTLGEGPGLSAEDGPMYGEETPYEIPGESETPLSEAEIPIESPRPDKLGNAARRKGKFRESPIESPPDPGGEAFNAYDARESENPTTASVRDGVTDKLASSMESGDDYGQEAPEEAPEDVLEAAMKDLPPQAGAALMKILQSMRGKKEAAQ